MKLTFCPLVHYPDSQRLILTHADLTVGAAWFLFTAELLHYTYESSMFCNFFFFLATRKMNESVWKAYFGSPVVLNVL